MNRRNFLNSLIGGVAATAAVRTWPFRVFSFPTEVKPFDWYTSDVIRIDPIWGIGTVKIPYVSPFEWADDPKEPTIIVMKTTARFEASCEWPDAKNLPLDDFEKRFALNARSR